jgi:hypothetical protein
MLPHRQNLSRRDLLKTAACGLAAALLAACQTDPEPILPDVYLGDPVTESSGPVPIDRSKIVAPPPTPPQPTDYGSIMPRSAWTTSPLQLRNAVLMNGVTKITIHHSGDGKAFLPRNAADVARHLQLVQQAHLQRGMIDIGYHFAVDPQGRVWQLRWLQYEGQHVRPSSDGTKNNPHNVGIVVLGDFNLQTVTAPQRDHLFELVRLLRTKYGSSPSRPLPLSAVYMHGEIVDTDCPGRNLKPLILDARRRNLL